jgi:hypothetical protein
VFLPRSRQARCDCEHSFSGFGLAPAPLLAADLAANFFFSVCSGTRLRDRQGRCGQPRPYLYFEDEPQRQMSMRRLSRDEAFLLAVKIAKLVKRATADIEGHSEAAKFSQPRRRHLRPF